jgi:L-ascorbate metabolism protein UlaG (beta-lactamase superfamily)
MEVRKQHAFRAVDFVGAVWAWLVDSRGSPRHSSTSYVLETEGKLIFFRALTHYSNYTHLTPSDTPTTNLDLNNCTKLTLDE